jgi:urease accessory protein
MTIVERVTRATDLPAAAAGYARDRIALGWEERMHGHGRRSSERGVPFGLALPRGTVLRAGDCLLLDDEQLVVVVEERADPVFVIEPSSTREWALFAYQIGNRHQPLMITDRSLICPDVPGVEQLLQQHRIPYTRAALPFTPATAAARHSH